VSDGSKKESEMGQSHTPYYPVRVSLLGALTRSLL
jgi:hypothetical protein